MGEHGIDLRHGVCTIAFGNNSTTGFYYGNGWVMTIFRNNDFTQSLSNEATFTFNFNGEVFQPHGRMAFVHRLILGDVNVYMAMVKLGIQGNPTLRVELWEREEHLQLDHLDKFADQASLQATVTVGSPAEALYPFVNPAGESEIVATECWISQVRGNAAQGPVVLKLASTANTNLNFWPLTAGASGCPIVIKQNGGQRLLAGIYFDVDQTSGYALQLSNGNPRRCLDGGVKIFPGVERYLAWQDLVRQAQARQDTGAEFKKRANEDKNNFLQTAKNLQLSIYICNGESFPYTPHP